MKSNIDLAVDIWKEIRTFIHDSHDKKESGEALTTVLLEYFDGEEIVEVFKFDKNVINSVAEQTGTDISDDDIWEDEE